MLWIIFKKSKRPVLEKSIQTTSKQEGKLTTSLKYAYNEIILNRKKRSHVQESVHICAV